MLIVPYNPDLHRDSLVAILMRREMDSTMVSNLPAFGLIAIEDNAVIGCGFLRKVEGNFAMLDSFMTDPTALSWVRCHALDMLAKKLISIARENNHRKLICLTVEKSIQERAETYGFLNASHLVMVKTD